MRLRDNLLLLWMTASLGMPCVAAPAFWFHVLADDPGSWPEVLSSVGLTSMNVAPGAPSVVIAPTGTNLPESEWTARVEQGTFMILEGDSPLARAFGFQATSERVAVRSVEDLRAPKLRIVWEKALDLPVFEIPQATRVFARERWQHAPLMAGFRRGKGAVLWLAAAPGGTAQAAGKPIQNGAHGYDRFPYILQAMSDLGFEAPFRSRQLWAFFDSAYRSRADVDYLAAKWRAAGIGALHVAAWHNWESDPQSDEYLRRLIEACHRRAIQVYAWFELPHVSEKFWDDHPQWREQTALLQDAQLDWRKLMNLSNPEAFAAVSRGVRELVGRFDWDGVNLAELYFESLEGHDNPARFTPMNGDIRREFQRVVGFDPLDLFNPQSPGFHSKNTTGLARFLEFRADLARRQQEQWIGEIEAIRRVKPHLDLVLTHVDDRFDASMREKIGADASRLLPLLQQHNFTFLIEDPATIWNLGPQRYPQIAARYRPLTPAQDKLAIDINVVERYQDVYPTKQQTGVELFELVHTASAAFLRVALYFESSIARPDLPLLSSAASVVERVEQIGGKLVVKSPRGVGIPWSGPALVDGRPWPVADDETLWLTPGAHAIEAAGKQPALRILDFNGDLKTAIVTMTGIEVSYESSARALVMVNSTPRRIELDGVEIHPQTVGSVIILPRGQHLVTLTQ